MFYIAIIYKGSICQFGSVYLDKKITAIDSFSKYT